MSDRLPPVYFYIPQSDWPEEIPDSIETYWQKLKLKRGMYNWTLQTYLRLKESGFPCKLISILPDSGIVVAHWDFLAPDIKPGAKILLVCIQADRARHRYAQLHLVQNPQEEMLVRSVNLWKSYYMPFWPQPGLIPRDTARVNTFQNAAYIGRAINLAPELQETSWSEKLQAIGLNWHVIEQRDRWHDYSDIDVVVAVRSFKKQNSHSWKPANKLYNAWSAGVPAILGCDSAFRSERQSELDYLEVTSPEELVAALKRLRDDKQLRHQIIENGHQRSQETTPKQLVAKWQNFLINEAVPAYENWCRLSDWERFTFLLQRDLAIQTKGMRRYLRRSKAQMASLLKLLYKNTPLSSNRTNIVC